AYFCLVNGSDLTLLTKYRCSNKDKLFVKTVLDAYGSLLSGMSLVDLMRFDPMILKTAYQFSIWQNHKLELSYEQLVARKNTLPIQHVNELAITGKDLLEWSPKKRGSWIKQSLDAAVEAVLNGKVQNDKQQLKEWFYAFHDEG
ncbi:MAG: CCA tRNA nucleotidyltransferase, partial [Solibacillus isronensis]